MSRETKIQCDFCKAEIKGYVFMLKDHGGVLPDLGFDLCNWKCAREYLNAMHELHIKK